MCLTRGQTSSPYQQAAKWRAILSDRPGIARHTDSAVNPDTLHETALRNKTLRTALRHIDQRKGVEGRGGRGGGGQTDDRQAPEDLTRQPNLSGGELIDYNA